MSILNGKNKRCLVVCDWLQVFCMGEFKSSQVFDYELKPYGNKTFNSIAEIFNNGKLLATIAFSPRSSVINPKGALIKISNNCLYCSDYVKLINNIIFEFGYTFVSISRLDLAIDFNTFNYGLHPEKLIKNYLSCKYTKLRKNDFKIHGKENIENFKLHGRQSTEIIFETLRFGNNVSAISIYLYNKTAELKAKTHKEYIVENWKRFELDINKDVWRLEISIKGNTWKFVDENTGEIRNLNLNDLMTINILEKIYFSHFEKYFDFRYNKNKIKRSRLKKISLFDKVDSTSNFVMSFNSEEGNRMDKIFIRMLENYNCQIRNSKREYKNELGKIVKDFSYDKGLLGFYYNKVLQNELLFIEVEKNILTNMENNEN